VLTQSTVLLNQTHEGVISTKCHMQMENC